jgi:hypothetical protein
MMLLLMIFNETLHYFTISSRERGGTAFEAQNRIKRGHIYS